MEFVLTEEHQELRAAVRSLLDDRLPSSRLRAALDQPDADDAVLWTLLGDMGMTGLAVPEQHGGAGAGAVEQGLLFEELGRVLAPGPFFATVALAGSVAVATGDPDLNERLAAGSWRGALGWVDPAPRRLLDPVGAAVASADGWSVTGRCRAVLGAAAADALLVLADGPDGPLLLEVPRQQAGVQVAPLVTLDLTRGCADVVLTEATGRSIGDASHVEQGLRRAMLLLAAEQVGGAQRCLDTTVAYAGQREQFGRPIGSFQAVKHRLADLLVRVELARSAAYYAACHPDEGPWVSVAAATCSDAYLRASTDAIQLHGGIGFTWEHDAHLHHRRAKADAVLLGGARHHRAVIADHLVAGGAA